MSFETKSAALKSLTQDSILLRVLLEEDDTFHNIDARLSNYVSIALPLYDGLKDSQFDKDSLLSLIEAMNYLGCGRLDEVLVMMCFQDYYSLMIANLNEDIKMRVSEFILENTLVRTYLRYGMLGALKRRYNDYAFENDDFRFVCAHGHLETAKWLCERGSIDVHANENEAYRNSCFNGHLEVAKWLYEDMSVTAAFYYQHCFPIACWNGYLSLAKWLHETHGYGDDETIDYAFFYSCFCGHLEIVQWLTSLSQYIFLYEEAFCLCCSNNYLNVAQHLYGIRRLSPPTYDQAFHGACEKGHLSIAQWLHGLDNVDIHADKDALFRTGCSFGYLNVVKWLYSLGDVNIHAMNDMAFRLACCYNRLDVAQWLYGLGGINLDCLDGVVLDSTGLMTDWVVSLMNT